MQARRQPPRVQNGIPRPVSCKFFSATTVPTGELGLGTRQLTKGQQRLERVEMVGANERALKALKAYMFGIDYVKLVPVQ